MCWPTLRDQRLWEVFRYHVHSCRSGALVGIPIAGEILLRDGGSYIGLIGFTGASDAIGLVFFVWARVRAVGWRIGKQQIFWAAKDLVGARKPDQSARRGIPCLLHQSTIGFSTRRMFSPPWSQQRPVYHFHEGLASMSLFPRATPHKRTHITHMHFWCLGLPSFPKIAPDIFLIAHRNGWGIWRGAVWRDSSPRYYSLKYLLQMVTRIGPKAPLMNHPAPWTQNRKKSKTVRPYFSEVTTSLCDCWLLEKCLWTRLILLLPWRPSYRSRAYYDGADFSLE